MKNKKLLIGGAVVVGGLLFLYFRNKRSTANGEERSIGGGSESGSGSGSGTTTTTKGSGTGTGSGSGTTTTTGAGTGAGTGTSTSVAPNTQVINNALQRAKESLKGKTSFNGLDEPNSSGLDFDGNIVD